MDDGEFMKRCGCYWLSFSRRDRNRAARENPDGLRGHDTLEAAADEGWMVAGEDLSELLAVRFGAQGGEDFGQQRLPFPHTPPLAA